MVFFILSGKMVFPFLDLILYGLRRKTKDGLSQKNAQEYDLSCIII